MVKYTEEQKHEALELYEQLKSVREVSTLTGVSIGTISRWINAKKNSAQRQGPLDGKGINPNPLRLANGNDLTAYIGRDVTQMQPREIWDFLRLLNVKGDFKIEQTIHL